MSAEILWYVSRSTGVMAQILLTAVMVLGILTAGRAVIRGLPRAALLRLHRNITLATLVFTAVHIASAIIDGYVSVGVTDVVIPFGAGFDPWWIGFGAVAVDLMLAIGVTSALRRHLGRRTWRAVHLSAYAMWPVAMLHGWGTTGGDSGTTWMVAITVSCIVAVSAALIYRLARRDSADTVARRQAARVHPVVDGAVLGSSAGPGDPTNRELAASGAASGAAPWGEPR